MSWWLCVDMSAVDVVWLGSVLLVMQLLSGCGAGSGKAGQFSCLQRNRLIGIKERDRVVTVERLPGARVVLTCHYCDQPDAGTPKRWYWTSDLWAVDVPGTEVDTGASNKRFKLSNDHALTIHELDANDTGLYYCFDPYHSDTQHKYIYAVDMLFPQAVEPVAGSTDQDLKDYVAEYINHTIKYQLRTYWRFKKVTLYLNWEEWSSCHACRDQPGQMWRLGVLRVRHVDFKHNDTVNVRGEMSVAFKTGLAARSMHVFMHEKRLSLALRELPDYLQKANCTSSRACRRKKSHRNSLREDSFLAKLSPEPRKRFTTEVYEGDPVIFECPWPPAKTITEKLRTLVSKTYAGRLLGVKPTRPQVRDVDWYYYSTHFNKSSLFTDSKHRKRISRDGRLMIASARKEDQGRYSCGEDGLGVAIIELRIKPTFTLAQSRTSLRLLCVGLLVNACVFVVVSVVVFRQRRVQRLLAGARWRHELREQRRERSDRRRRFLLQKRRELLADQLTAARADELADMMEAAMSQPEEEEEAEEPTNDFSNDIEGGDVTENDFEDPGDMNEGFD